MTVRRLAGSLATASALLASAALLSTSVLGGYTPTIVNAGVGSNAYYPEPVCSLAGLLNSPAPAASTTDTPSAPVNEEDTGSIDKAGSSAESTKDPQEGPEGDLLSPRSASLPENDETAAPVEEASEETPQTDPTSSPTPQPTSTPSPLPTTDTSPTPQPTPTSSPTAEPADPVEADDAPAATPLLLGNNVTSSPAVLAAPYGNPCAPYALTLDTAPTDGIAQITWEQSKPSESLVGHYVVSAIDGQRDISFHVNNPDPNSAGPFNYTMWGLAPDSDHTFTVSARNIWRNYDASGNFISDEGEASASTTGRTQAEATNQKLAPGVVLGIAGSGNTDTTVINWTEPTDAGEETIEGYIIYIDGTPTAVVPADTGVNGTYTHTLTGLTPGERTVTVVAYTETTLGGRATTQTFTVASVGFTITYAGGSNTLQFDTTQSNEMFAPTADGAEGAISYSLTGALPEGATFDAATGTFTGPATFEKPQTYEIGDTGPGGGIVFATPSTQNGYPGQYLEVLPSSWDFYAKNYVCRTDHGAPNGTGESFGDGRGNTQAWAALGCTGNPGGLVGSVHNQDINGFSDWFIPSTQEMIRITQEPEVVDKLQMPTQAGTWTDLYITSSHLGNKVIPTWIWRFEGQPYVNSSGKYQGLSLFDLPIDGSYRNVFMAIPIRTFTAPGTVPLSGWPATVTVAANDGTTNTTLDLTLTQVGAGQGNADEPTGPVLQYAVGDIGPAGGTVFAVDADTGIGLEAATT